LQQAYSLDQQNRATDASNAYDANNQSPEAMQKALMTYLAGLGTQHPDASSLMSLLSAVYQRPQVPVSGGLGGILSSIIPMATQGGGNPFGFLSGLFGGGGGMQSVAGENTNS
jgi:hypothetical protein